MELVANSHRFRCDRGPDERELLLPEALTVSRIMQISTFTRVIRCSMQAHTNALLIVLSWRYMFCSRMETGVLLYFHDTEGIGLGQKGVWQVTILFASCAAA